MRRLLASRIRTVAAVAIGIALITGAQIRLRAQDRVLGKQDIIVLGFGLTVAPAHQVVPKDIATIVSTFLHASNEVGDPPPFAPSAIVRGTLRGPGAPGGIELTAGPNSPFNIPPLSVPGL